jgi:(p)ppGpp synthase/HD superfamily hydrolase
MEIDGKEIERAISYLTESFNASGHNPKPVIFHSLKMAISLLNFGYNQDIIIAAVLHDLLEDTDITYDDIKTNFGVRIAEMVSALSFDTKIKDKKERERKEIDKAISYGKEAMIVKAADFIDNSYFYHLVIEEDAHKWLIEKINYFVEKSRDTLKDESIWKDLTNRLKKVSEE